jgi:hypothetical protein
MKRKTTRLSLHRETLRHLGERDLARAAGAAGWYNTFTWCQSVCLPCPDTLLCATTFCDTGQSECDVCVMK